MRVVFATRGSELALWQTRAVASALQKISPEIVPVMEVVRTTGDRVLDVPLARIGDRGLFTKELDAALLDGSADVAVHSLKDVPTRLPDGLLLAAITPREDPRDVLVCRRGAEASIATLSAGARVGTSSLRRRAQLRALRPDLEVVDLRGNLNTRIAKLDEGRYDAILLAAAGINRLGWAERISEKLDPEHWLPAVGQGALAVVIREDRRDLGEMLSGIHDPETGACTTAERGFLGALEGGCQVPIGALGHVDGASLMLDGFVSGLDGTPLLRASVGGGVGEAASLGRQLAQELCARGALAVLEEVRASAHDRAPQPAAP